MEAGALKPGPLPEVGPLPEPGSAAEPPGFEVQPLPAFLRWPGALVEASGTGAPRLTPERILRAAGRRAGLRPDVPSHVEEPLELLCRSLHDEARLHWFGRMNLWNLMVTGLAELLLLEETFRRDPGLEARALIPPLVVTGLPRSGTTFLHRLLATASDAAGVALHRHLLPVSRGPTGSRLEAEALLFAFHRASRVYGFDAIHFVRAALPDECNLGMRLGLRSMIFWSTAPTYGYLDWLLEHDLRETYRLYRRVLLLHQAHAPGRRLTLKCPQHLGFLPALREAMPEALIVQTHREPREVVPSESRLILSLQATATPSMDWRKSVASNCKKLETYAARSVADADTAAGRPVLHLAYTDLVRDPVAVVRSIHQRFALPFSEADAARVTAFARENRQHKHGRNPYSLEQFDLRPDAVDRAFRPYTERFLR